VSTNTEMLKFGPVHAEIFGMICRIFSISSEKLQTLPV